MGEECEPEDSEGPGAEEVDGGGVGGLVVSDEAVVGVPVGGAVGVVVDGGLVCVDGEI